ncbi:uncharacterized protein [Aquarana catesbeiana]|uniref:uncharacterized protein n=1 Tax=Aquarana catesbeiana TaxID=8400 RepID=UPI003CC9B368
MTQQVEESGCVLSLSVDRRANMKISKQLFLIVLAMTIGMASGFPITPTEETNVASPRETNTPANHDGKKNNGYFIFYEDYLEQDSSSEQLQGNQRSDERPQAVQQSNEKLQARQRSGENLRANQETDTVPEQSPSRGDLQDVPMWLLSLIIAAIGGIFVMLLVGCVFCMLTCLKQRSKIGEIGPKLEAVIVDNQQLQEERKHYYFPSREELKEIVREFEGM